MTPRRRSGAIPRKPGQAYRRKARPTRLKTSLGYLGAALLAGVGMGSASIALTDGGVESLMERVKPFAVSAGIGRRRAPQAGDSWAGCDQARAAGSAPIYASEPGYRAGMDGDGDGIACEPWRGM